MTSAAPRSPDPRVDPRVDPTVTLAVPRGWAVRVHPPSGVVLAARAPRPAALPGPAAEIVVRAVPVEGADLDGWREAALGRLREQADDFTLEDDDRYELSGAAVRYHRFAHRCGATEMVSEQWAWWRDGLGVTLTGSVAREDYLLYAEVFEEVAATVEITWPAAPVAPISDGARAPARHDAGRS